MPDTQAVPIERVEAALEDVAYLVTKDSRYLPVFERLLKEHKAMEREQDLLSRAHAIVKGRTGYQKKDAA
jgi:hypothetical protein